MCKVINISNVKKKTQKIIFKKNKKITYVILPTTVKKIIYCHSYSEK